MASKLKWCVVKEFEGDKVPKDLELKWSPFWVQIHNLPLKSRTRETGTVIGASLGEVLDVDVMQSGVQWSKYLRVRVKIDVTRKLIRGKRIAIEEGTTRWVNFKYERLPNFCYSCSMLDHDLKDCLERKVEGFILANEDLQYGAWMRGEVPVRRVGGESSNPRNKERVENRGGAGLNRGMRTATEHHMPPETSIVGATSRSNLLDLGDCNMGNTTKDPDKLESKSEHYQGNGKSNLGMDTPESCMSVLGMEGADVVQCLADKGDSMYWEKATHQEASPRFDFALAPKQQTNESKRMDYTEVGPMAMCYEKELGWVAEKLGPGSKHWKRIERKGKAKEGGVDVGPTKLKREGPTPIDELDTNIIDLKRRKGKTQVSKTPKGENVSDGREAVAARQHRRAQ
ncbi:hypothetical protein SO802_004971 [Lithocarpus litseifolius]|uniref:Zinc knuckle CX2CX4HX4C domain-containing protein n=1 Tax=Lithocarpus litseifolius TaxID=425828 RepID=A0AAW2DJV8_9ROSI